MRTSRWIVLLSLPAALLACSHKDAGTDSGLSGGGAGAQAASGGHAGSAGQAQGSGAKAGTGGSGQGGSVPGAQ